MNWVIRLPAVAATALAATGVVMAGGAISGASAHPAVQRASVRQPAATTAPAPALRYYYRFVGATGVVPNSALGAEPVQLTLHGAWSRAAQGVHFRGGTHGVYSVADGKAASGDTLAVPAADAVGVRARMRYDAPTAGSCFGDTPNVTQVGRFSAYTAQVKLQLSKCADSKTQVMFQCRFAGSLTPLKVKPVQSGLHLVNGGTYVVTCIKSRDRAGAASVALTVTRVKASGNRRVANTFTVAAVGAMDTKQSLSVGNKFPVPSSANNTDQLNGDVDWVKYCVGSLSVVQGCLTS